MTMPALPTGPRRKRGRGPPGTPVLPPAPPRLWSSAPRASSSSGTDRYFEDGKEGVARQDLFDSISPIYDDLNDRLSLGMHRVWKRMAVRWSRAGRGDMVLDSCCGSGDIAQIASEVVGRKGRVVGLDFSKDMLTYARGRVSGPYDNIEWVQGDAMEYPYADETFSAATMGYGLRNVSDRALALRELSRVLKRGAYASILDFNNARGNDMVDGVQGFLLQNIVVPVAENAGVGDQYRYLRPSIEGYPTGSELEQLALANGFSQATFYEIGLGFMGCLVCRR